MNRIMTLLAMLAMIAAPCFGASVQRLTIAERATIGATHRVVITQADLTETSTNTAQTLGATFSVAAGQGVELIANMLVTDFDTISTNYTTSCALTVGDGGDADRYLTTTELCVDGTEVDLKFGRPNYPTYTATTLTNLAEHGSTTLAVVTSSTVSESKTVYTSADYVDFTFTPNAQEALASFTTGEIWVYIRIWDTRNLMP